MSLLARFLGSHRSKAYAKGVALLEEGRFAEAVDQLRTAAQGETGTSSGSLASFHFRQAVMQEGRRQLRAEQPVRAVPLFAEAVQLWDQYPDLHCLYGAATGLAGDWDAALPSARSALRLNPDYVEARLLEATALGRLSRNREAAESLNALVESGRRVDHWLVAKFSDSLPFSESNLPDDLAAVLLRSLSGRSEKEEVAAAVALCRAGRWLDGLERFSALVEKRPRYPDYRTRLAAALFQMGRNDEALTEVNAALVLNETYLTAQDLKGLILADEGRLSEAYTYLADCDTQSREGRAYGSHEELFGAYLRGVLELLHGDVAAVERRLGTWPDLERQFARAALLLAAAADLAGHAETCENRLSRLAGEWPGEGVYVYLLACHMVQDGRLRDAEKILGRWTRIHRAPDARPLYLHGLVDLAHGRPPVESDLGAATAPPAPGAAEGEVAAGVPDSPPRGGGSDGAPESDMADPDVDPAAWALVAARDALLRGDATTCWDACKRMEEEQEGRITERLLHLQMRAALEGATVASEWSPCATTPESCLPSLYHLLVRQGRGDDAEQLSEPLRRLHPELSTGWWLSARFWLAPVRGWIA